MLRFVLEWCQYKVPEKVYVMSCGYMRSGVGSRSDMIQCDKLSMVMKLELMIVIWHVIWHVASIT